MQPAEFKTGQNLRRQNIRNDGLANRATVVWVSSKSATLRWETCSWDNTYVFSDPDDMQTLSELVVE